VTVSGITEMYVYHYVMMTESTYRKLYQAKPEINTLFLRLKEGAEAGEEIKAATAAIEGVDSVDFVDFVIRNFETMIQGIDGVVLVLVAASMGLAFVVLGNLTNVNISERMREIATLKVLGKDDIGIVSSITSVINKTDDCLLRSISIQAEGGLFEGMLTVNISHIDLLDDLIKKILNVKGVKQVQRL
jgi:predicted amino acid-binding ACT domain protein